MLFGSLLAKSWDKNTFLLRLNAGITLEGAGHVQDLFPLGGFLRLSGFSEDELAGKNVALTSLGYYRRIYELGFGSFGIPLYVGGSLEYGGAYGDSADLFSHESFLAGAAFFGADTPFGPLYLGFGVAERGHHQAYLKLGEVF
jgi:NTE family protein